MHCSVNGFSPSQLDHGKQPAVASLHGGQVCRVLPRM